MLYHDIFNYKLSEENLQRWTAGPKLDIRKNSKGRVKALESKGTYTKSLPRVNENKLKIAKKAARALSLLSSVTFVGVTGSLAMRNAKPESDIDLMIITKTGTLWSTRLLVYVFLFASNLKVRQPRNSNEQDKLCLNVWFDESKLAWIGPQNAYTAHEIAQVVPLLVRGEIYVRWIDANRWIFDYWPHSLATKQSPHEVLSPIENVTLLDMCCMVLNTVCFWLESRYMSGKITRERVTLHYAFFHPFDWAERVMHLLQLKGVTEVL